MATVTYKCPNCGSGLTFDPSSQQYKCEYCISEFSQEQLEKMTPQKASEQTVQAEAASDSETEYASGGSALLYTCPSCGAEIVTDETTAATFCFYCHNPVVLAGRLDGKYHPDYVVPFAIDREKAKNIFVSWMKQKKYVPKAFFSQDQIEKMTGVYFPYWLYNCQVDGTIAAEGTRLKTWVAGNLQYTETQKFDVSREGSMDVKHLTRNALKKADKQLVEGVLPFDMDKIQPFSMGYLSGFVAEKRDMEKQDFSDEVKEEIEAYAASNLQSSLGSGYSSLTVQNREIRIQEEEWKYALMPVWTLTYKDKKKDKIYYFACNGQTGKICGRLPVDPGRLAILFGKIFLPLLAVLLAAGYFI